MRKLVTLRKVSKLSNIDGADFIQLAQVDGWQCVVKKGEFEEGDWGIYFEIDSMVPHEDWIDHLFKNQKDIDRGFLRIKTIRLRGQLAQGLMLPLPLLLGKDLTEAVGVYKYEPPVPEDMSAKSRFPSFIQKTDEERIQNLVKELAEYATKLVYESEKLDGSSITVHCVRNDADDGWTYGVSSRNLELKLEVMHTPLRGDGDIEEPLSYHIPAENKFVSTARKMKLQEKMIAWCEKHGKDLVLQGELIGVGIQGNRYGLKDIQIRFYTIQDGKHGRYNYHDTMEILSELDLLPVPILGYDLPLSDSIENLIAYADGKSELYDTPREGVVYRAMDNSFSFKIISNKYLLGEK